MYIIMKKKIQKTLTINCENISLQLLLLLLSCFSRVWLCETPIDGSPPGSSVSAILQARTLEWVAISFSSAWKWKVKVRLLSRVRLLATSWTAAYQAPPSMRFSRQEYWSGVPSCFYLSAKGFPSDSVVKNLTAKQETQVWSLGQEDPLEKGMATHSSIFLFFPLQYSCLENPMDREDWQAIGHRVAKESDTTEAT